MQCTVHHDRSIGTRLTMNYQLENTFIKRRQNILLHRPRDGLQRLVCLTLAVVVLHILHGCKGRLDADGEAFVTRVVHRLSGCGVEDVGFSILVIY